MQATIERTKPRLRKAFIITGSIILLMVTGFLILVAYSGPILRGRAVAMLEQRFDSDVQLGRLRLSLSPGIGATGSALILHRKGEAAAPPLISIKKFYVESTLFGILSSPPHLNKVHLEGLEINVGAGAQHHDGGSGTAPRIEVGEIDTNDTVLRILPGKPGKDPLVFDIHQLQLRSVGPRQPMSFSATLRNAKPPGQIHSIGSFGPWQEKDPGRTPVSGKYNFEHANLGVFQGISGVLSSRGTYKGTLDHIEVDGETDTPDFTVRTSGQPVHLETTFHSIVDGTDGDTLLQPVDARFGHSTVHCVGGVVHHAGSDGKTVSLDVTVNDARIEDLLRLAVKSDRPMMTGAVRFHAKLELPPGHRDVADRLYLKGAFGVEGAHFTRANVQERIANLSHRAQGHPEDGADAGSVASNLRGSFILKDGVVTFSKLSFGVRGALIALDGTYNLDNEQLDFHGTARLQAELSQMTTGWKALLLKVVDPFFKKKGAGTVLRIRITGVRENPSFGLDL